MLVRLLLYISSAAQVGDAATDGFRRPSALLAMEEARRSSIRSGVIEWSHMIGGKEEHAIHFRSRFARSGDMIMENRGDREGWTLFDHSTGPPRGVHKYPQVYMINDDGLWHIQESGVSLRWWTQWRDHEFARKRVRDIRNVGLSLSTDSMDPAVGMQAVLNDPNHRVIRWEETRNGDICEVTGHTNSGGRIQWVINAAKGWNVEQLTFELGDLKQEAVCVLREFDGVWFPETTDYFMNGELLETVQIRSASLNKPADRDRFTLSDMGAESGAPISVQPPSPRAGESLRWNGEDICSDEKWQKDLKEGKRQWGPMLRRMFVDGEPYSSPYETEEQVKQRELDRKQMITRRHMTRDRGLWEEYVRKFIARYQLDEAQSTQAKKILDMCQKRADEIISKKKVEFLNAINEIHAAKNANDAERVDRLEKRVAELRAPIEEIFERELKPRLDSLPTRAQRKAAEQADDSQPAKPP